MTWLRWCTCLFICLIRVGCHSSTASSTSTNKNNLKSSKKKSSRWARLTCAGAVLLSRAPSIFQHSSMKQWVINLRRVRITINWDSYLKKFCWIRRLRRARSMTGCRRRSSWCSPREADSPTTGEAVGTAAITGHPWPMPAAINIRSCFRMWSCYRITRYIVERYISIGKTIGMKISSPTFLTKVSKATIWKVCVTTNSSSQRRIHRKLIRVRCSRIWYRIPEWSRLAESSRGGIRHLCGCIRISSSPTTQTINS